MADISYIDYIKSYLKQSCIRVNRYDIDLSQFPPNFYAIDYMNTDCTISILKKLAKYTNWRLNPLRLQNRQGKSVCSLAGENAWSNIREDDARRYALLLALAEHP